MVRSETFPNGLTLLVEEVRVAPVVALNLWVGVGSADESERVSGVSHFLEHMVLKARPGEERGPLARTVQDAGGYLNASTGCDHTTFYQVVPSLHWSAVLEAQAEVLGSPHFTEEPVDAERSVIMEETRMSELTPSVFSWRRLMESALAGSGYGRRITGSEDSLERIDARALSEHFDRWYAPGNMVQVVVGDVDADRVIDQYRELLSRIGPGNGRALRRSTARPDWTPGCALAGGSVRQPYLVAGFGAPPVSHPDIPVLDVLCGLLGLGRSSRLRKSLQTDSGLVSDVGATVVAHRDVGVVALRAVGTLGASPSAVVEGLFREVELLRTVPVGGDDMLKSIRRLEAGYLLEHETVESVAMTLGFFETMGSHSYAEEYIDRLAAVTPDDVMRVANLYLDPGSAAVFAYVPEGSDGASGGAEALSAAVHAGARSVPGQSVMERGAPWVASEEFVRPHIAREAPPSVPSRRTLSNGTTLVVRESGHIPLASIAFGFRGGFVDEPDDMLGITRATLKHMIRGTTSRSAVQLADAIEGLGSGISTSVDRNGFGAGATVLARHFAEAAGVLCEAVSLPAFAEGEFERVRAESLADISEAEDNPFRRTMLRLVPLLFPGHPYGRPIGGTEETLSHLSAVSTSRWHASRFASDRLFVCVTGDIPIDTVAGVLEGALADLPRAGSSVGSRPEPLPPAGRVDGELERKGQSSVAVGFRGPRMGTRESAAMHVLSSAMSMMGGRLWRALRERPPHAYSVSAMPAAFRESGALVGYVTTRPGGEEAAAQTLISELSRVGEEGLSTEELERGQRYLAGMLEISMQQGATRAASYVLAEVAGVGYEHVDRLPAMVRSITSDDIVDVARRYLTAEDGPAVAILRG